MINFSPKPWKEYSESLPWVCGLMTFNSEMTIYETLKFANKMFDFIIISDDGSTDATVTEVKRFISDFNCRNIEFHDVSKWDPIPSLRIEKDHGLSTKDVSKTISKARLKNFYISKNKLPHSIYFALEDDVIVDYELKGKIKEKIQNWKEPMTDCEYFNVANMINKKWLRLGNPDPHMKRRKLYENSGDWTFACWYSSGFLTVAPDPGYPYGPCLFPWLEKNQIGKKGQNIDPPYGYHFLYYRKNRNGFVLEDGLKRIKKLSDANDSFINKRIIEEVSFKVDVNLKINGNVSTLVINE